MTPENFDKPFDRQLIAWCREQVDAHRDRPYEKVNYHLNWLWFSQAVAAMERGLET